MKAKYRADVCLCSPGLGYVCHLHLSGPADPLPPETIEESDHLAGYGHRRADQDGGDGEEWVSPIEHKEFEFLQACRELLDAEEITP